MTTQLVARRSVPLVFMLLAAPVLAERVLTSDHGNERGGAPFRIECVEGEYVTGFEGRHGAWVDAIAPRCSAWSATGQSFTGTRSLTMVGGGGGAPTFTYCDGAPMIYALDVGRSRTEPAYIDRLRILCRTKGSERSSAYFNGEDEGFPTPGAILECPLDYVAVGIHGRAGDYLDAIGLVCAPLPGGPTALVIPRGLKNSAQTSVPTAVSPSVTRRAGSVTSAPPPPVVLPPPAAKPEPKRYDAPVIASDDGVLERLDYCLNFASDCGEAAANAFCAASDPNRPVAIASELEFGIGRTFTIGDRRLCQQDNCSSFVYVLCGPR